MKNITSSYLKQNFGQALKITAQSPLLITKNNEASAVLLSVEQYEQLRQYKFHQPERFFRDLVAYSNGEISRLEVMKRIDTDWYGDVINLMNELSIPFVEAKNSDEMTQTFRALLRGEMV